MRIFRRAILVSVLALGCAACASKPAAPTTTAAPTLSVTQPASDGATSGAPPASSAQALPPGASASIASIDKSGTPLTLISSVAPGYDAIMIANVAPRSTGASPGSPLPSNGEYEVTNVSIQVRSGTFTYDVSQFRFLSANGRTYTAQYGSDPSLGFGSTLKSAALAAGQKVRGALVFDVPKGGGQVQFFYTDGTQAGGWTIAS